MALTQHGWIMSHMAAITETGNYILEPPGFDPADKAKCKALLSSLSVAGKTFGMVLVNRTLNSGVGVRVMHIDHQHHAIAAARYRPWNGDESTIITRSDVQRSKVRKKQMKRGVNNVKAR